MPATVGEEPRSKDHAASRAEVALLAGEKPTDTHGKLLDLDWDWIRACNGLHIGELRINERLAGFDNWRVIFCHGDRPKEGEAHKVWILQIMKKKNNAFTDANLNTFRLRRLLVRQRYYESSGD